MNNLIRHLRFALIHRGPILDVGSGSNPFWRANVLMERFLADGTQREGRLIIDRPTVCGDIHELPFLDNSFIFVYCSHVLEHVRFPEKAVSEIVRVGQAGYIETPSEIHEYFDLQKPYHRWAVSDEGDALVFREKSKFVVMHPVIHALRNSKNRTSKILRKMHDKINLIKIFWGKDIDFRVERIENPIEEILMDNGFSRIEDAREFALNKSKIKLKRLLNSLYRYKVNIDRLLACPDCKSEVIFQANTVLCKNCKKKFPIVNGIPIMLRDAAQNI